MHGRTSRGVCWRIASSGRSIASGIVGTGCASGDDFPEGPSRVGARLTWARSPTSRDPAGHQAYQRMVKSCLSQPELCMRIAAVLGADVDEVFRVDRAPARDP